MIALSVPDREKPSRTKSEALSVQAGNEARRGTGLQSDAVAGARYLEEYVPTASGVRLFTRRWLPAQGQGQAIAVVVHGLGEHTEFYLPLIHFLLPKGMAVYAHDHRGFGRSDGRRGHISRYGDYVEDLRGLVERARVEHPDLPLVLIGHSMGGTIALLFSQRYPEQITYAIYSAPSLILRRHIAWHQRVLGRAMSRIWPTYTSTGTIDPTVLTHDLALQEEVRVDQWRHAHVTARLYTELFVRGPREVLTHLDRLRVPFLILHGLADPLVSPIGSQRVYDGASVPVRAMKLYPGLLHEPFREVERAHVFADVAAWLQDQGVLLE
jgi:alpha-beta hydrolase superfamily lysophospholipase